MMATIVLLPAYARLTTLRYHRDVLDVRCDNAAAQAAVNDRVIHATTDDEVFTKRMAMSRLGLYPTNEIVAVNHNDPHRRAPYMVTAPQPPLPAAPAGWLVRSGKKLENPPTRRGLMLLAGAAMFSAFLLFAPRSRKGIKHPPTR
jgi:hypothetical protein